ncbi:hypothetical protein CLV24_113104 [Pontibacter ummariensis]|uniref:Uncharacterized protein n=1 Tax=Pontibacter ummariensis TaxID=1610492 RepID=A0A239HB19_9BACT|nr:hypothetical protein CLV24_113104 [Pontibacter ummariensis]SNS78208.1 hypothetical protein SAMN06296052_11351 [Pontibacter ummariensis]
MLWSGFFYLVHLMVLLLHQACFSGKGEDPGVETRLRFDR